MNIYDLLRQLRRLMIDAENQIEVDLSFLNKGSLGALREYSKRSGLFFPLDYAKSTVLRGLLVHMF